MQSTDRIAFPSLWRVDQSVTNEDLDALLWDLRTHLHPLDVLTHRECLFLNIQEQLSLHLVKASLYFYPVHDSSFDDLTCIGLHAQGRVFLLTNVGRLVDIVKTMVKDKEGDPPSCG